MPLNVEYTTPDYTKSNGLGREYVDAQLDGVDSPVTLSELRNDALVYGDHYNYDEELTRTLSASPWIMSRLASVASKGIIMKLYEKTGEDYTVTDPLFENILQANNHALAETSREMRSEFKQLADDYKTKFEEQIALGILPISARDGLPRLAFSTLSISEGHGLEGASAQCDIDDQSEAIDIKLNYKHVENKHHLRHIMFHELTHAITPDNGTKLFEFFESIFPTPGTAYDLTKKYSEVLTEQVAQVLLGLRDIEDTDVEEDAIAYPDDRKSFAQFKGKVPFRFFVDIYFGRSVDDNETRSYKRQLLEINTQF